MLQGTAGRVAELKTQGALEASRDPNSGVDARAAEDTMMNEAKAAGAASFEFDPDATPEQKKAQMKAVSEAQSKPPYHKLISLAASASRQTAKEAPDCLSTLR